MRDVSVSAVGGGGEGVGGESSGVGSGVGGESSGASSCAIGGKSVGGDIEVSFF